MKKKGGAGERRKSKRGVPIFTSSAKGKYSSTPVDATESDTDRPKTGSNTLVPQADIDFLKKSFKFYDKEK